MVLISSQTLREELEDCSHALSELDVAMQEFGEQNPLLARQLGATLSKLTELHSQTSRLAEGRSTRLKKVNTPRCVLDGKLKPCGLLTPDRSSRSRLSSISRSLTGD